MCERGRKIRRKKNEETKPIFEVAYLGNAWSDFAHIWNVECWRWRECPRKKIVLFHQGSTELRRCENCVFFLPVNILTGVARRLLGPHDTLPCVLIYALVCNNHFYNNRCGCALQCIWAVVPLLQHHVYIPSTKKSYTRFEQWNNYQFSLMTHAVVCVTAHMIQSMAEIKVERYLWHTVRPSYT